MAKKIKYKTVRALNPSFDPAGATQPRQKNPEPRMQTVLRPGELRRIHAAMSREFAPSPPTVLSLVYAAEEAGVEITDSSAFRRALEKDLDTLGLGYQGSHDSARQRNAARRLARGDHR